LGGVGNHLTVGRKSILLLHATIGVIAPSAYTRLSARTTVIEEEAELAALVEAEHWNIGQRKVRGIERGLSSSIGWIRISKLPVGNSGRAQDVHLDAESVVGTERLKRTQHSTIGSRRSPLPAERGLTIRKKVVVGRVIRRASDRGWVILNEKECPVRVKCWPVEVERQ
jgi:hypothetical protein